MVAAKGMEKLAAQREGLDGAEETAKNGTEEFCEVAKNGTEELREVRVEV